MNVIASEARGVEIFSMAQLEKRKTPGDPGTYTGELIEKQAGFASGDQSGEKELCLRLSMGDYPIRCAGDDNLPDRLKARLRKFVKLRGELTRNESGQGEPFLLVTDLLE